MIQASLHRPVESDFENVSPVWVCLGYHVQAGKVKFAQGHKLGLEFSRNKQRSVVLSEFTEGLADHEIELATLDLSSVGFLARLGLLAFPLGFGSGLLWRLILLGNYLLDRHGVLVDDGNPGQDLIVVGPESDRSAPSSERRSGRELVLVFRRLLASYVKLAHPRGKLLDGSSLTSHHLIFKLRDLGVGLRHTAVSAVQVSVAIIEGLE